MKHYYSHAGITIYHGDCLDVIPHITADFCLTSPPYVDQRTYSGGFPSEKQEWLSWITRVVKGVYETAKSAVFVVGDRRRNGIREWDSSDMASSCKMAGIPLWERFLWLKFPFGPNGSSTQPDDPVEFCLWFGENVQFDANEVRRDYAPSTLARYSSPPSIRWESNGERKQKGELSADPSGARPTTVIVAPCLPTNEYCEHPAQFPLELASWFIAAGSRPRDTVLDVFSGSGTTLYAARQMGRKAIGIEIEERYCEIAAKRLAQEVLPLE